MLPVHTACGDIRGVLQPALPPKPTIAAFLGIPFAQPPTGREGRWRAPRDPVCWSGTLEATSQPKACPQWHPPFPVPESQSEDCLYLNVFTQAAALPTAAASAANTPSRPVFLFWYGGDSTFGTTESYGFVQELIPLMQAEHGSEVLVVTANYRLNSIGFLSLAELSAEQGGHSGNYGLQDCQAALRWLQANIAAFGGDPTRITVIGQSSGATQILGLFASPASRGLFSAAISLSGSPNITMDLATAEAQGRAFVNNTRCAAQAPRGPALLDCLYNLTFPEVVAAMPDSWDFGGGGIPAAPHLPPTPGLVVVDGRVITKPLLPALQENMVDAALLISSLEAEMDLEPNANVTAWTTAADFEAFVRRHFAAWQNASLVDGLLSRYQPLAAQQSPVLAYYELDADIGITCGTRDLAVAAANGARRSSIYFANVRQGPSSPFCLLGNKPPGCAAYAFHIWDYICGFGAWSYFSGLSYKPTDSDKALGKALRTAWLQLAQTGSIAAPGWARVNSTQGFPASYAASIVRADGQVVPNFKQDTCAFLSGTFGMVDWWAN